MSYVLGSWFKHILFTRKGLGVAIQRFVTLSVFSHLSHPLLSPSSPSLSSHLPLLFFLSPLINLPSPSYPFSILSLRSLPLTICLITSHQSGSTKNLSPRSMMSTNIMRRYDCSLPCEDVMTLHVDGNTMRHRDVMYDKPLTLLILVHSFSLLVFCSPKLLSASVSEHIPIQRMVFALPLHTRAHTQTQTHNSALLPNTLSTILSPLSTFPSYPSPPIDPTTPLLQPDQPPSLRPSSLCLSQYPSPSIHPTHPCVAV
jgi:predicted RNA-binding protein